MLVLVLVLCLCLSCACACPVLALLLADEEVVHRLTMVSGRLDDPSRRWLGGLRCTTIRFPNDASNVSLTNPALSFSLSIVMFYSKHKLFDLAIRIIGEGKNL